MPTDPRRLRRDGLPPEATARALLARHLQYWTRASRETHRFTAPPLEMGRRFDALDREVEGKRELSYTLERVLFGDIGQAARAIVSSEARRAVQLGFAEALTTHALTGRWPTQVSGVDPFTGGPLRVKRTARDFRVYSVGRDGKDDGGRTRREAPKTEGATYDEAAVYPAL